MEAFFFLLLGPYEPPPPPHDKLQWVVRYSGYGYEVIYPSILIGMVLYCPSILTYTCKRESVMRRSIRGGGVYAAPPPPENSNKLVFIPTENRPRTPTPPGK